jgi:hypothetical protein
VAKSVRDMVEKVIARPRRRIVWTRLGKDLSKKLRPAIFRLGVSGAAQRVGR